MHDISLLHQSLAQDVCTKSGRIHDKKISPSESVGRPYAGALSKEVKTLLKSTRQRHDVRIGRRFVAHEHRRVQSVAAQSLHQALRSNSCAAHVFSCVYKNYFQNKKPQRLASLYIIMCGQR